MHNYDITVAHGLATLVRAARASRESVLCMGSSMDDCMRNKLHISFFFSNLVVSLTFQLSPLAMVHNTID